MHRNECPWSQSDAPRIMWFFRVIVTLRRIFVPLTLWTLGLAQPWINCHFKRLHFRFTQPLQPKGRHISLIPWSNLILRPCVFWSAYRLTLSFPAVPHRAAFSPVRCSGGFPPQALLSRISVSPQCFLSRASLHVEHPGKASLLFLLLLHCRGLCLHWLTQSEAEAAQTLFKHQTPDLRAPLDWRTSYYISPHGATVHVQIFLIRLVHTHTHAQPVTHREWK